MIDVVVPFHRQSDLENLGSWKMGSHDEFTFVVIHDSFPQGCTGECKLLSEEGSNVVVTCGQFGAPGLARNAGIKLSKHKWIMFLDADDGPNFSSITKVLQRAIQQGNNAFMGNFKETDGLGRLLYFKDIPKQKYIMNLANKPGLWRFAFAKELLDDVKFSNHRWGEDQLFLLTIFSYPNLSIHVDNECIYEYRKYGNNQLTNQSHLVSDLVRVLDIEFQMFKHAREKNFYEIYDLFAVRQIITIVQTLGVRAPKPLIIKTFLLPVSIPRSLNKLKYAISILISKIEESFESKR